ncbi:MAG: dUTP diphosphatase, partial [Gammaproteobacteria bacterium]
VIGGRQNKLIGTGLAINIQDPGLVAVVASRSGLCLNHQIRVGQGLGVVDSDYHGEIGVILQNDGENDYVVNPGERIAQLLFMPVVQVAFKLVPEFTTLTERGAGGFGSTGKS